MLSVKKVELAQCYSCGLYVEYGIRIKEMYLFCGPECRSKKFREGKKNFDRFHITVTVLTMINLIT